MSADHYESQLPEGLVAIVKRECPTCQMVAPVLTTLAGLGGLTVYSQDDPSFPAGLAGVRDDTELGASYRIGVDFVPTLLRVKDGKEVGRVFGWNRSEWRAFTGAADLGGDLPENRPGCGSMTTDPGMPARLAVRFNNTGLQSQRRNVPSQIDPVEYCFEAGWTDGLPVVPPTEVRVLEMLDGTRRSPQEVVGLIPPNGAECTVEKVAINAVMAGCKPEYMPVVLTAIEAALDPDFGLHGILATTNAPGPVVMVNGPIARAIGMNSKGNVFGQGWRANASIGRTLQLVVRNVGGGKPQGVDRAVFGNPGKYTFCFAEDDSDPRWTSFSEDRGFKRDASTVTVFGGDGVQPIIDQVARTPEELIQTYAGVLKSLYGPRQVNEVACVLAVGYEHQLLFYEAGWSKQRLKDELIPLLQIRVGDMIPGRSGLGYLTEDEKRDPDRTFFKFRTTHFEIIRAGGNAGKYSAAITSVGFGPATKEVTL